MCRSAAARPRIRSASRAFTVMPPCSLAEAALGGMFSSRLMQEIRVKRGWSYGAGCALRRSRLPHWFEIWSAAGIDVAGPCVALMLELFADYAAKGPTDDEVDFARSYLVGAMPFHVATARQRMQLAVRDTVFELPQGYTSKLPESLAQLTAADVRAVCARHLRPDDTVTVAVTTAENAQEALSHAKAGPMTIVNHDEYCCGACCSSSRPVTRTRRLRRRHRLRPCSP